MNNFVFSQDPLLLQSYQSKMNAQEDIELRQKQLNDMISQYKQLQQIPSSQQIVQERDYLGELDSLMKGLKQGVTESLLKDNEYTALNEELQTIIQEEIMANVKWKINANPKAANNIEKQIQLINQQKTKNEEEEQKNLNEINDYMRNYSSITFDEYKRLKNKKI